MSQETFPCPVNVSIPEDAYWIGLSKQNMDFHQVIGELIDNSISASGLDRDGDLKPFVIEFNIQRVGNEIRIKVADQGIGISLQDLREKILAPGGKGSNLGPLNEHGFGLKNALCVLTCNELPFRIQTRDNNAIAKNQCYLVKGPFRRAMQVELDDLANWNMNLIHVTGDGGTRVFAVTTYHFFNTLYKRATTFSTLIVRLIEHLGVMYRGFLGNTSNKLWLRWQDQGEDGETPNSSAPWEEHRINAISIPYDAGGKKTINLQVSHNGINALAKYEFGLIDKEKTNDDSLGVPYPLRIYYKGNIPTQGLDVRFRNRVIAHSLLPEIWHDMARHNDYNKFIGELILDEKFRSVNNKTNIDPHNPFWEKLLAKMNENEFEYKPQRITRTQTEETIKSKLKTHLEGLVTGSKATLDHPVWGGAGIKADIVHIKPDSTVDVYEVKAGTASPQDVYQLLMYWDGLVEDGKTVKLGRLVAKSIPPSVETLITYLNTRRDVRSQPYSFETKTVAGLGISM